MNLKFKLDVNMPNHFEDLHPQEVMHNLGIKYRSAEAYPFEDEDTPEEDQQDPKYWIFFNVDPNTVPKTLPIFLEIVEEEDNGSDEQGGKDA